MAIPATSSMRPPDARTRHARNHMYLVGRGFLYTSPRAVTEPASGFAAAVVLSLNRGTFLATIGGDTQRYQAVAAKPLVERTLHAENLPTVSVGVSPNHRNYRRFRAIPRPGRVAMDRAAFRGADIELEAAYRGRLTVEEATHLFEEVLDTAVRFLPKTRPADPRIERALDMLQENANYPLKELADAIGLSYDRMSYLFAETIGLPLRSYLLWQKLHIVASLLGSGRTLTEIALAAGFNDSAHLSNTWQKAYGVTPSYFLKSECVEIHSLCLARRN